MISRNIDLTEHRDFSASRITINSINNAILRHIRSLEESSTMSLDEFDLISRYELLFGSHHRHKDMKEEIFHTREYAFDEELRTHCEMCGKWIRAPWKLSNGGLCKECDDYLSRKDWDGNVKFPWNGRQRTSNRDTTMDIFNLR